MKDTCQCISGDSTRKLRTEVCFIDTSKPSLKIGTAPVYIAINFAANVYHCIPEDSVEQSAETEQKMLVDAFASENGRAKMLILKAYEQDIFGVSLLKPQTYCDNARRHSLTASFKEE